MVKTTSDIKVPPRAVLEMESLLSQVQNVKAVKIMTDIEGRVQEIHAIAEPGRHPRYIARDFMTVIQNRWGVKFDHRRISIAQLGDEQVLEGEPPRLQIKEITYLQEGLDFRVQVALFTARLTGEGQAKGPASKTNRLRLTASATLEAISKFVKEDYRFVLEGVQVQPLGARQVMLTCVTVISPRGEELPLVGACLIRKDEIDAVVRSTLASLNRRLGLIAYLR